MYIYPKEIFTQVHKGTCSRTFIGTFATKGTNGIKIKIFAFGGRNRRQPRCLLLGEWMVKPSRYTSRETLQQLDTINSVHP